MKFMSTGELNIRMNVLQVLLKMTLNEVANRTLNFMISSILGPLKAVVKLLPVRGLNAETFLKFLLDVISYVQNIGYKIICIVADNNRVNQRLFIRLLNSISFVNPY